jgi:hypothetical protein
MRRHVVQHEFSDVSEDLGISIFVFIGSQTVEHKQDSSSSFIAYSSTLKMEAITLRRNVCILGLHNVVSKNIFVKSEVFIAVTVKNVAFWDIRTQFVPHRKHITSPLHPVNTI